MQQTVIKIKFGDDEVEVVVSYDRKDPGNYTVIFASHNENDVTDFYRLCEAQNEALFYGYIIDGIAEEICSNRIESGLWSTKNISSPIQKRA